MTESDLAAKAFHQPISRDLIGRLAERGLIGTRPREPRRGASYTFVTTDTFLAAFGMASLRDMPDLEPLTDAGLINPTRPQDIQDTAGALLSVFILRPRTALQSYGEGPIQIG